MLLNDAPVAKSLVLVRLVGSAPGPKTRSSPAVGARSACQLKRSVHRLVAPPPSQMRTARSRRSSNASTRGRKAGRLTTTSRALLALVFSHEFIIGGAPPGEG